MARVYSLPVVTQDRAYRTQDGRTLDCSVTGSWPPVDFEDGGTKPEVVFGPSAARRHEIRRGGSKPEVVFRAGSRCRRHVFWIDVDHLRLAQSLDKSSTAPENYFRFSAATLEFDGYRLSQSGTVGIYREKSVYDCWGRFGRSGEVGAVPCYHFSSNCRLGGA